MKPHLAFSVENKLSEDPDAGNLKVDLNFKSMDDFSPENVARQVGPLRELLELRDRLRDLRGNMQGNDKLEELLREAVTDKDKLAKLRTEMGKGEGSNEQRRPTRGAAGRRRADRRNAACSTRSSRKAAWRATPRPGNAARTW